MDINLLKRYFENQCTPGERQEVSNWLADEANKQEAMRLMEGMWDDHVAAGQAVRRLGKRRYPFRWAVAAAVVGLLVSIAAVLLITRTTPAGDDRLLSEAVEMRDNPIPGEIPDVDAPGGIEQEAIVPVDPSGGKSKAVSPATPQSVKAVTMQKAKLVNEQKFLDLLASLDSASLTNLFTYRHTHLQEILTDIQQKYDLEITVCDDSLNRMIVNKDFDAVNLRELLFQIRREMDLTFSVNGNRILICFNREK